MKPVSRIPYPVSNITVLLTDDNTLIRKALRMVLTAEKDIRVIAEAQNGREAIKLVKKFRPDVVVMDIAMPLLNGFEATRQIMKLFPKTKILVLSAHSEDEYIDQMIAIGAAGFLIKQSATEILSEAIREVQKGNTFFSPEIAKRLGYKNKKLLGREEVLKKVNARLFTRRMSFN